MVRDKIAIVKGLKINYKFSSGKKTKGDVLILHGWGGSSTSWSDIMEFLSDGGYRVFSPDFPGFGRSRTPHSAWNVQDFCDFILGFIDELKMDKFFLLGHSFGGRISIRFSRLYPEKVAGLSLCDSAGIKQGYGLKEKAIFYASRAGNAILSPAWMSRFRDAARNFFYLFFRHKDYVKADGVMKEVIKKVLEEDLLPELSQIKSRTLIVWGEDDKLVPVKYARIFKEKIAGSLLEIIPNTGHSPHLEKPGALSKIILNFLGK